MSDLISFHIYMYVNMYICINKHINVYANNKYMHNIYRLELLKIRNILFIESVTV